MDDKDKKLKKKDNNDTQKTKSEDDVEQSQDNSFWKKLGSAVKKAVDCCLEG